MKKQYLIILLIFGLLFSATFGITFKVTNGFEFKGFWLDLPIKFFDLALNSSNELILTSQFIGNIFYLIFGIACINRIDFSTKVNLLLYIIFCILILLILINDIYSIYQDINNQFEGRHFRTGSTTFIIGLLIYLKLLKE